MATAKKIPVENYQVQLNLDPDEAQILIAALGCSKGLTSSIFRALHELHIDRNNYRVDNNSYDPLYTVVAVKK